MSQDPHQSRSLLAPIDGRYKPSPADFERVQTKLRSTLAKRTSRASSSMALRLAGLSSIALMTVGVVLHPWTASETRTMSESPTPAVVPAPLPDAPEPSGAERNEPIQHEVGPATPVPVVSIDALPRVPRASRTAASIPSSSSKPPDDDDTLAREARLLARAESAFRVGNDELALTLLDEHAKEFPSGVLVDERIAERVIVLCHAGHVEQAKREGRAFLAKRGSDPLARRVAMSCAGASTQPPAPPEAP